MTRVMELVGNVIATLTTSLDFTRLPAALIAHLKGVRLPRRRADLRQIADKIKPEDTVHSVLKTANIIFPYSEAMMTEVLALDCSDDAVRVIRDALVKWSFVAWLADFETTEGPPPKKLLRALLNIRREKGPVDEMFAAVFGRSISRCQSADELDVLGEFMRHARVVRCEFLSVLLVCESVRFNSEKVPLVLDGLVEIMERNNWCFSDEEMTTILGALRVRLHTLDHSVLRFIVTCGKMSDVNVKTVIESLPWAFLGRCPGYKILNLPATRIERDACVSQRTGLQRMAFPSVQTLPDGFDPSFSVQFPADCALTQELDDALLIPIGLVIDFLRGGDGRAEMLISGLFERLNEISDGAYFANMYGFVLVVVNQILPSDVFRCSTKVARMFFDERIFDPGVTVFDEIPDFAVINTARAIALECMLADSGSTINHVLDVCLSPYPMLLAETCLRLANMAVIFALKVRDEPRLIRTLENLIVLYQELEILTEGDKSHIRLARVSLFVLLAHLLSSSEMINLFFVDADFADSFLAFLFEAPVQRFVIDKLGWYLRDADMEPSKEILMILKRIIEVVRSRIPEQQSLLLLVALVTCLRESLAYRPDRIALFGDICSVLCQSMAQLDGGDLSREVFDKSLSFFALMSPHFLIQPLEMTALISGMTGFDDPEFITSLFKQFIALLTGRNVGSLSPNCIVRQPQVLKLFLVPKLFDAAKLPEMLELIMRLCKYSPVNLSVCAASDLDLFVVRSLEKEKHKESFDVGIVKQLLNLYSLLAFHDSTVQSVLGYISLMAPLGNKCIWKYQKLVMDNLQNMIMESMNEPERPLPLCVEKVDIEMSTAGCSLFKTGISVTFWLYLEPSTTDYIPRVFTLLLGMHTKVKVFLSNGSMFLSHAGSAKIKRQIATDLPTGTWKFIIISFDFMANRTKVSTEVTGGPTTHELIQIGVPNFEQSEVAISVGGACGVKAERPSYVGPFGVHPKLSREGITSLFEFGVRNNGVPKGAIGWMSSYFWEDESIVEKEGFVDVLIMRCGVHTLLPLYSQAEWKDTDGSTFFTPLETILTLISGLLCFSLEAQRSFYQNNGFAILAHLITHKWTKHYTWATYSKLFDIMLLIQYEPLQQQLFDEVMTDFTCLMHLPPVLHAQIVKHWANSLFTSFSVIGVEFSALEDLMTVIRLFYWYEPVEIAHVKYADVRSSELDVGACRRSLFEILRMYGKSEFTKDHFKCIVGHIAGCREERQVMELLEFLKDGVATFELAVDETSLLQLTVLAVELSSEQILSIVIEIVLILERRGRISQYFATQQLDGFVRALDDSKMTASLLTWLEQRVASEPLLLPLSCYVAIHVHEYELIAKVRASPDFVKVRFWAIWPLVLCMVAPASARETIMSFLVDCSKGNLCWLYAQIDVLLELRPAASKVIESVFMGALCRHIEHSPPETTDAIHDCFSLCQRLICLTRLSHKRNPIADILRHTEVEDNMNEEFISHTIERLLGSEEVRPDLDYALDIDINGKWAHEKLALLLVSMRLPSASQTHARFQLLLCGYLFRVKVDVSKVASKIPHGIHHDEMFMHHVNICYTYFTGSNKAFYSGLATGKRPLCDQRTFKDIEDYVQSSKYKQVLRECVDGFNKRNEWGVRIRSEEVNIPDCVMFASKQMHEFIDRQNLQNAKNKMSWKRLRAELSIERGPWYNQANGHRQGYNRDMNACLGYAPVKMMRTKLSSSDRDEERRPGRRVLHTYTGELIDINVRRDARIDMYEREMKLSAHGRTFVIGYPSVVGVFRRRNYGMHLFTVVGRSFHIEFSNIRDCNAVINVFCTKCNGSRRVVVSPIPDPVVLFAVTSLLQTWRNRRMSNYEYILNMNSYAGRSFNDITQYPVFPWVLERFDVDIDPDDIKSVLRDMNRDNCSNTLPQDLVISYLRAIEPFTSMAECEPVLSLDAYAQRAGDESTPAIPEFYSMPEILGDVELPKWANSPIDFVYKHRKILESDAVSLQLHHWLTRVFGGTQGTNRYRCIDGSHPPRNVRGNYVKSATLMITPGAGDFCGAIVKENGTLAFKAWLYDRCGSIVEVSLSLAAVSSTATMPRAPHTSIPFYRSSPNQRSDGSDADLGILGDHRHQKRMVKALTNPACVKVNGGDFVVVKHGYRVTVVDGKSGAMKEMNELGHVNDVSSDGIWTVVGGHDTTLTVIRDYKDDFKIRLFGDAVTACAVSSVFKIAVGGTRDSALVFCSVASCSHTCVVSLGDAFIPEKLMITPGWGFVVAYCTTMTGGVFRHYILVYTINGLLVRKQEIGFAIDYWHCWSSTSGFDYIAYATESGRIYVDEVYYVDPANALVFKCHARIVSMYVTSNKSTLISVGRNGEFAFFDVTV